MYTLKKKNDKLFKVNYKKDILSKRKKIMDAKTIENNIINLLQKRKITIKNTDIVREMSVIIEYKLKNNYYKNRKHKDNITKNNKKYLINKIISIYEVVEKKIEQKEITVNDVFDKNPTRIFPEHWKESLLKVENEKQYLSKQ